MELLLQRHAPPLSRDESSQHNNILEVTERDINDCYNFTKRVGNKWGTVLQRDGYNEYAQVVFGLVQRGKFLDSHDDEDEGELLNNEEGAAEESEENESKKFMTTYAELKSLRRYEADCDGSGRPSRYLPSLVEDAKRTQDNNTNGNLSSGEKKPLSSARRAIQQIDQIVQRNGGTLSQYGYEWDAINIAAKRNEKRLYITTRGKGGGFEEEEEDEGYEIVPKTLANDDGEVNAGMGGDEGDDSDMFISTNTRAALALKRKRKLESMDVSGGVDIDSMKDVGAVEMGRSASTIGDTKLTMYDCIESMSPDERRQLIVSSIRPPYPFEDTNTSTTAAEGEDPPHTAIVCGSLKSFGTIHLWEQTRNHPPNDLEGHQLSMGQETKAMTEVCIGEQTIYGAAEAQTSFQSQKLARLQKQTTRRAIKERTGRRVMVVTDQSLETKGVGTKTKARWTESTVQTTATSGTKSTNDALSTALSTVQHYQYESEQREQWLELDLGECILELTADRDTDSATNQSKKLLAFRSLEVALKFNTSSL